MKWGSFATGKNVQCNIIVENVSPLDKSGHKFIAFFLFFTFRTNKQDSLYPFAGSGIVVRNRVYYGKYFLKRYEIKDVISHHLYS